MPTSLATSAGRLSVRLLSVSLLLAAGCGSDRDGPAATEAGDASGSPSDGATSVQGAELPVEATYAGLVWSITQLTRETADDGGGHFVATLDVENPTDRGSRWPAGVLTLRSGDGGIIEVDTVDPAIEVAEGETTTVRVDFEEDDGADPADLSFVVAETDRLPESVPLVGEPVDNPYPLEGVDFEGTTETVRGMGGEVSVTAVSADIAIDSHGERALTGQRLAVVDVDLTVPASSVDTFFDGLALEVDGVRRDARETFGERLVDRGTSERVTLLFDVPRDAQTLALTVFGGDESEKNLLPITFDPSLPACCDE